MVRNYEKKRKTYTEETVKMAIEEVSFGKSLRAVSAKYNLSKSMLQKRYSRYLADNTIDGRGKATALPKEVEANIALCLQQMKMHGLLPTLAELKDIVREYLLSNQIPNKFTNNRPGYHWATGFLQRHNLTLKSGRIMPPARKNATSEPFAIYCFYMSLQAEMERLQIMDRPQCIWFLEETGFHSKMKAIHTNGSVRISWESNGENIRVVATCCANGKVLDPFIIFKGNNMQTAWCGTDALPDIQYTVSDNGLMNTKNFYELFKKLCVTTKSIRPLLLIVNDHFNYASISTIELAIAENISILKLPAHCTDMIQPLDVSCFAPLKSYYDVKLREFVHKTGANCQLGKADYVNILDSIWRKVLSEEKVRNGFRATGIYPLDRNKYKGDKLDSLKLLSYKEWNDQGQPRDDEGNPLLLQNSFVETNNTAEFKHLKSKSLISEVEDQSSDKLYIMQEIVPVKRICKDQDTLLPSMTLKKKKTEDKQDEVHKKEKIMDMKIEPFDNVTIKEEPLSLELNESILNDKNKQKQMDNIDIKEETLNLNSGELHSESPESKGEFLESIFVQEGIIDFNQCDNHIQECEKNTHSLGESSQPQDIIPLQLRTKSEPDEETNWGESSSDAFQEKNLIKCRKCSYSSPRKADVIRHLKTHTREKPFQCELCPYRATYRSDIEVHFTIHSGERPFKCSECSFCSIRKTDLDRHTKIHSGEKCFKCKLCPHRTLQLSDIKKHLRIHKGSSPDQFRYISGGKLFKCAKCSFETPARYNFNKHVKRHSGEKPFKCELCSYTSSRKADVERHTKTHTGERSFKCKDCPYIAAQKNALKVHLRNHINDKPFKCDQCSYSAERKCDLDRHIKMHKVGT